VVKPFLILAQIHTRFLISPIVVAEVYAGAFEREHKSVEALFDLCERIDMDHATGKQAGQYAYRYAKACQGIALDDFMLAATACVHRCPLWTLERTHHRMVDIDLLKP
jgi:predicted nucleic acid-binding protein